MKMSYTLVCPPIPTTTQPRPRLKASVEWSSSLSRAVDRKFFKALKVGRLALVKGVTGGRYGK